MAKVVIEHFYERLDGGSGEFRRDIAVSTSIAAARVVYGIVEPLQIMRDHLTVSTTLPEYGTSSSDGQGVETEVRAELYEIRGEMIKRGHNEREITEQAIQDCLEEWSSGITALTLETLDGGKERFLEETNGGEFILWATSVPNSGWTHPESSQPLFTQLDNGLLVFNRDRA